jgi:3-oxoacyl-[acyl-carrier-protein] synthase II
MYYIHTISSISHQQTFDVETIHKELKSITTESPLLVPEFKEILPPIALRRLNTLLKISLTTALKCLNDTPFDGIVVGTGLGCLQDTEKFLVAINNATSDVLSPTAFIQSTHNTIGGQISLFLKNHAYNMTHTQNALSFEISLLDGMTLLNEGKKNILVGAADEKIAFLELLNNDLIKTDYPFTSIATFCNLKTEKSEAGINVKDVFVLANSSKDIHEVISQFLEKNRCKEKELSKVYHSDLQLNLDTQQVNYLEYTGYNYVSSALAFHIGVSELTEKPGTILIVNSLAQNDLGLILIERC